MADENNYSNFSQGDNSANSKSQSKALNATHDDKFSSSDKYKNVEPLPESSRPRRDGPGGENGD